MDFCVQYEPLELTEAEMVESLASPSLAAFLSSVCGSLESILLQNELVDIFSDEYAQLGEEEVATLEQGTHVHLQEYQSFTDLLHSKDKSISCIDWHPTLKGVLAISCVQRSTYDEKIEAGYMKSGGQTGSLILVWSFQDPIRPQLILEAPDDIHHFEFNPHDPNIIVGGCITGQIVIWDISEYEEKLKMNRGKTREGEDGEEGGRIDRRVEIVKWIALSSIEGSHRGPVVDLAWMPDGMEVFFNKLNHRSQTLARLLKARTKYAGSLSHLLLMVLYFIGT
jgi:WD40 repeat protein